MTAAGRDGASSEDREPLPRDLCRALHGDPSIRLAVLFGTTATGDDRSDSDIDLLLDLKSDTMLEMSALRRRLRSAAGGRDLDLVLLPDAERAPALLADALKEGCVIFDRDGRWQSVVRRSDSIFEAAQDEEEATSEAAWRGIDEARRRARS